jgi:hypothetical protein
MRHSSGMMGTHGAGVRFEHTDVHGIIMKRWNRARAGAAVAPVAATGKV